VGASYFLEDSKNVPCNVNCTISSGTMQNDDTSDDVLRAVRTLKACKKFHVKDQNVLILNLQQIESWQKAEYPWIEELNHGKGKMLYDSVDSIMSNIVGLVEKWESCTTFNETSIMLGGSFWKLYIKRCSQENVELEIDDLSRKSILADRRVAEERARIAKEHRQEGNTSPPVVPIDSNKLPYQIEMEQLRAEKERKRQIELDKQKQIQDDIRERVKRGEKVI